MSIPEPNNDTMPNVERDVFDRALSAVAKTFATLAFVGGGTMCTAHVTFNEQEASKAGIERSDVGNGLNLSIGLGFGSLALFEIRKLRRDRSSRKIQDGQQG